MFLIVAYSPGVSAAVTTGATVDIHPNSSPYIRDNSTAIPLFAFGASSSVATDRLSRVEVTFDESMGMGTFELVSLNTNGSRSGVALVRDDGSVDDEFDEDDTPVTLSSINWLGGWPLDTCRMDMNALIDERVPQTLSGSYQWFIVIRTDEDIDQNDRIRARLYANAIDYSDGSSQPGGTVWGDTIIVYESEWTDVSPTGYMTASDEQAVLGLEIIDGGPYEYFDAVEVNFPLVSGWTMSDLATIGTNPTTSGIAMYRNDGDGSWDGGDVGVAMSSVDTSAWPSVMLYPSSESVPDRQLGSYEYWIVLRTSATAGHMNWFYVEGDEFSVFINGTLDVSWDRQVDTPYWGNADMEFIRIDAQAPSMSWYSWNEWSSYLHYTGGTLWFNPATTWSQTATLRVSASDSWTGVRRVYFSYEPSLSSGGFYDYSSIYEYTYYFDSIDTDASAPITITMEDNAGNTATRDIDYAMDVTSPGVTIVNPTNLDTLSGVVTIQATATDAQAGVRYNSAMVSWDGGWSWRSMPWDGTHFSYDLDTTLLADGQYRIVVQVQDEVTNVGSAFVNIWTDNTGPSSVIYWPTAGQYMHSAEDLYVVAAAADFSPIASMEVQLNSGGWSAMTWDAINSTWRANLGAPGTGTLVIEVRATDTEGNLGPTATVVALGDGNDPTASVVSHAQDDEVSGTMTIQVDADDAESLSMVKVALQSGSTSYLLDATYNPVTGYYEVTVDTTTLADGTWSMAAVAWDEAGRYTITTPFTFVVDNTEPTLAIVSPTNGAYIYGDVTVQAAAADTGSGMDNGAVAISIDGGAWSIMTLSGSFFEFALDTTTLADGAHTINVAAMDDAGNWVARSITVVVDNTQPTVAVVAPEALDYVEGAYTFAISAVDNFGLTNVWATITGPSTANDVTFGFNAASGYYEWTADTTAWEDGSYTIKPFATELSGRTYLGAETVTFYLDNNAPSLVVVAPMDGEVILTDSYDVTVQAGDLVWGLLPGDVQWRVDANPWEDMEADASDWTATWFTTDYADGTHTLSFRATDAAGHTVTHSVSVTVDNTDPAVSLNTPSMGEYVEGVYTFSARATDSLGVASVVMAFGFSGPAPLTSADATYNPSTGYWELTVDTGTLPDGPATLVITATDSSSRQTTTEVHDFAVDNNAPTFLLMSPSPGEIVLDDTVSVLVNASDEGFALGVGDVEYNLDGTGWIAMENLSGEPTLWGLDIDTTTLTDGEHTIGFRVTDAAGHVTDGAVTFTVDLTDPTASILSPVTGEFAMDVYVFRVAAVDSLGIAQVELTFTGIPSLTTAMATYNPASGLWEFLIDTTTLDDAEATISAMATDASGRTSQLAGPVDFTIDNNAPIVAFMSPMEGEILTEGQHMVTVSAVDSFFNVEYGMVMLSVDGGSWFVMNEDDGDFTYDWNTSGLTDGEHNLQVVAEDKAGHVATVSINVIVDNNMPALAIVSPTDGQFVTGAITFQVASSDARGVNTVVLSWVDGQDVFATVNTATNYYEYSLDTTTLEDGTYTLTAISTDGSGLVTEATVEFLVDNTEPELEFEGPLSGSILDGEVTVTATATDTFIDSLQFSVDGVGWVDMVDGSGTFDSTGFADGEHTITVRAIDGSGKAVFAESEVTIDNNDPVISVADFPTMTEHLAGDRLFAAYSDDEVGVVSVTVTIGDDEMPVYINPATGFYEWTFKSTDYADGVVYMTFTSMDAAGHNSTIEWDVFVDNSAPLITEMSPKDGAVVKEIVHFDVAAMDDTGIESVLLRIGHGPWIAMTAKDDGTYLYKWDTTTEDDEEGLEYTIRVTDDLGNTEDTVATIDVDNPMSVAWIALAAILAVLVLLGIFFMRKRDQEMELEGEPSDELEDISDTLDELVGLEPLPDSDDLAEEVSVELEEKSF
jgi:methionine-rich copper-binding protein CopC